MLHVFRSAYCEDGTAVVGMTVPEYLCLLDLDHCKTVVLNSAELQQLPRLRVCHRPIRVQVWPVS
jgi:hypothetical protein